MFGCEVGLSDHTMGLGIALASVALGSAVIDKHFTLARADGGLDSAFSVESNEMRALVVETERAWQALGRVSYGPAEAEKESLVFPRSLYIVTDLKAGDVLPRENVRAIRRGYGLAPKYLDVVLGKCVTQAVRRGNRVKVKMFE